MTSGDGYGNMKRIALIFSFLTICLGASAISLEGRVFLRDTTLLPGDFVMVYCQACGTGTLSDENGFYRLDLKDAPGNVKIEFSRIGYASAYIELTGREEGILIEDVILEPQELMLTAAYVTPEGMDPARFIMSKLWETAKGNRKKQTDYKADITYDVATHELPVLAGVVSKGMLGLVKFTAAVNGYGPLVRYCLQNDDLSATVSLSREVRKGKAKDYGHTIVCHGEELPEKVKEDIMALFGMVNLFDLIYGETTNWGQKFSKDHVFTLDGTYEYGDKLVDVLEWSDPKQRVRAVVHIVEEDWGILKVQMFTSEGEVLRCEARDSGNGVYMPVSFVLKPAVTMVRAEQIPELIEYVKNTDKFKKGMKERAVKMLESHLGSDFNPYISFGFNIRYRF